MANRPAPALVLRPGDRARLGALGRDAPCAGVRARIVLLAADGLGNTAIAEQLGLSRPAVIGWRRRYAERGLDGLLDRPRTGRPRRVDPLTVVRATVRPPPARLGGRWSARLLAHELGIGAATVTRAWAAYGVLPARDGGFRLATEPGLAGTVVDVVGLHHAAPVRVIALAVAHPRDPRGARREQAGAPLPGLGAGALQATARALASTAQRAPGRDPGLASFLERVERHRPARGSDLVLHLVAEQRLDADPATRAWLAAHPHVRAHTTGATTSWARLVTTALTMADRRATRPESGPGEDDGVDVGADHSAGLEQAVRPFLARDPREHPFVWTLALARPPRVVPAR